jgi:hypothetical protein
MKPKARLTDQIQREIMSSDADKTLRWHIQLMRAAWAEYITMKRLGRNSDFLAGYLETRIVIPWRALRSIKPKTASGSIYKAWFIETLMTASELDWDVSQADVMFMRGEAPDPKSWSISHGWATAWRHEAVAAA